MVFSRHEHQERATYYFAIKGTYQWCYFFMEFASDIKLLLFKMIFITTDGATAMMGPTTGIVPLCRDHESYGYHELALPNLPAHLMYILQ